MFKHVTCSSRFSHVFGRCVGQRTVSSNDVIGLSLFPWATNSVDCTTRPYRSGIVGKLHKLCPKR
ncbi:hypothetical protein QO002_002760 [Pararhizobium capsulatum DSM 1112]|uniref:Uncharacterized protein n=1 Tax=Pararhizobium capsulatum DSM 1112 TaxID=1121113 RepID=A0ABU0BQV2_9HYPH|nr:hypothetical protein [Pararhizobium capsulatum DSM 1112]